jgi:hypothetical protein
MPEKEIDILYSKNGEPNYRILSSGSIVSFGGRRVAYIDGEDVYGYNGEHLAWWSKGILRDHNGDISGFSKDNTDNKTPHLPYTKILPTANNVDTEPRKNRQERAPRRPSDSRSFSVTTTGLVLKDIITYEEAKRRGIIGN